MWFPLDHMIESKLIPPIYPSLRRFRLKNFNSSKFTKFYDTMKGLEISQKAMGGFTGSYTVFTMDFLLSF